jgi:GT2 family glycosyltransferase
VPTLREALTERENDYAPLADQYLAATGGDLVIDPMGSFGREPLRLTQSVSVLIGAYNSLTTLVPVLVALERSSFNQRHPELFEVIVVDDGSTDGTREALLGLRLDLRWTYVRQARGGLTVAHNTGLAFAQGDVVVFCDSDMVVLPFTIEELAKRHDVLPHVTLIGFRVRISPSDPRLRPKALPAALAASQPQFWLDDRLHFPGWPTNICRDTRHLLDFGAGRRLIMSDGSMFELESLVVGSLCSFKRADLLRVGGGDERLVGYGGEDTLIGARLIALGNPVVPVYSAVGWHVDHPARSVDEPTELAANRRTLAAIYDEPLVPLAPALRRWRGRAVEAIEPRRGRRAEVKLPTSYPICATDGASTLHWGAASEATGRYRDALAHYEAAASSRQPGEVASAHAGRARSLVALGDPVSAEAVAREARTPGLELPLALAAQGAYGQARDALAALAAAPEAGDDAAWLLSLGAIEHKRRANFHAEQGLHEIAVVGFDLALIIDPDYEWTHFDRSLSLRALGRDRDAVESLRRAGRLIAGDDRDRTWLHTALGELYLRLGEPQRAALELDRALRLNPENAAAAAARAQIAEPFDGPLALAAWSQLDPPINDLQGWLSPAAAALLSAAVIRACGVLDGAGAQENAPVIVELGSYYGRSTVTIAWTLRELVSTRVEFHAVDPHVDYAFGGGEDTEATMRENLTRWGVSDYVRVERMRSEEFTPERPVALLFIDALHEYEDVRLDYEHFRDQLLEGSIVAFHDYDPDCPGVMRLVDELLDADQLDFLARVDSLIVLARPDGP